MNLSDEITKALREYTHEVERSLEEEFEDISKEAVQKLKETSPARPGSGKYRKSWTIKRQGKRLILHNKEHYQLTHLLEKGHATRNGGRTKALPHIKPVEEWVKDETERRVKKRLEGI